MELEASKGPLLGKETSKICYCIGEILRSREKKSPGLNKTWANLQIIMSIQKHKKQNIYSIITFIRVLK